MRSFQRPSTFDPIPASVVTLLRRIDRSAGAEAAHRQQVPQLLDALRETARIESITASSAIEGVVIDDARVPGIVSGGSRLRNRNEAEFAGYTAALDYLHQHNASELSVGLVLHLHRLLFSNTDGRGGHLKTDENLVVNREQDGTRTVRFTPVSVAETPYFLSELVTRTRDELAGGHTHPLIVTAAFALDLSCIHPFADGNGRVVRLMTAHLLEQVGYGVGRYVSVEQLIYDKKNSYYEALRQSTTGWFDDGRHDLWPWATFLLERLAMAYELFDAEVSSSRSAGSKKDRVRNFIMFHGPDRFTINDIRRALPGISDQTIRVVLKDLREEGQIGVNGTGRSAAWRRVT